MEPELARSVAELGGEFWVLVGFIGGFLWALWLLDKVYKKSLDTFISEVHKQYTGILNSFGIYKKPNGEWQSHAGETISSGKEVKAYQRSDTESER